MKYEWTEQPCFSQVVRVPYYLCDAAFRLSPSGLLRLFTDASIGHAEQVRGRTANASAIWVIYAWDVVVSRWADQHETVRVVTFPHKFDRFYAQRNFLMLDEAGEVMAYANSYWLLLDAEKGRPVRFTQEAIGGFALAEAFYSADRPKLDGIEAPSDRSVVSVRLSDLDENHHVNNGAMLDWIDSSIGRYLNRSIGHRVHFSPSSFQIVYLRQIFDGEDCLIELKAEGDIFRAQIMAGDSLRLVAAFHR